MSSIDAKGRVVSLLSGTKAETGYYGLTDAISNTDGLFDNILSQWSASIRQERRQRLPDSIPVFGESTRLTRKAPAVYVYRNGVRQDNSPLGFQSFTGQDTEGNPKKFQFFQVRNVENLQCLVLSANSPQQRDDLFLVVRELLYRGVSYFSSIGAIGFQVTNARDGQFVTENAQGSSQIIFAAELDIQFFTSLTWEERNDVRGQVEGSFSVISYTDYT